MMIGNVVLIDTLMVNHLFHIVTFIDCSLLMLVLNAVFVNLKLFREIVGYLSKKLLKRIQFY